MWFEQLANDNRLSLKRGTSYGIFGNAIFNKTGTHRYFLERRWASKGNVLTAIMMNPSNATHNQSDKTVDQLIHVAKERGCNALYVVNISSIVTGTSSNLNKAHFSYEALNWIFISEAMAEANIIFIGWGMKGQLGMRGSQISNSTIVNIFNNASKKIYCYDVLKSMDKKFANKPIYYLPHPRPLTNQEKYSKVPIRQVTDFEFARLFY